MDVKFLFLSSVLLILLGVSLKVRKIDKHSSKEVSFPISIDINIDSTDSGLCFIPERTYVEEKKSVEKIRKALKERFYQLKDSITKDNYLDSVSIVFTTLLLNKIVPHWYGTPWDFEGHTSVPKQGEIACGCFVSTTLYHMGLNLNRYHLARKEPLNEAKTLAVDSSFVVSFYSESLSIQEHFFSSFSDGLYFVGLDAHVGYLYVFNGSAFFIHSNYLKDRVMLELVSDSEAFKSFEYHLVKISHNKLLIKKWLEYQQIVIFNS